MDLLNNLKPDGARNRNLPASVPARTEPGGQPPQTNTEE